MLTKTYTNNNHKFNYIIQREREKTFITLIKHLK